MRCWFCNEEVSATTVVYYPVLGERVPFHRALVKECLNEHIKLELRRIRDQRHALLKESQNGMETPTT